MSDNIKVIVNRPDLVAIADAVRNKTGLTKEMTIDEIANRIDRINVSGDVTTAIIEPLEIATNGTYTANNGVDGYSPITVNVQPSLQSKTITPTTSKQTITADSSYDGLSSVTVNAMSTATQATPSITVSSSGLITASATQTAGYVSAGTKSATKQLTTQAAKTITPTKSSQTAVSSGVYTTGAITVGAIPSEYIVPSGSLSITENGTHDVTSHASVSVNVTGGTSGGIIVEGIPEGYAKVDYIQFSGSQSFDSKIVCNQDTKIVVRYTRDTTAAQYLYGVVNSDNTASITAYLSSGGSWRFGAKSTSITVAADENIIRTAIITKTGVVRESATSTYSGVTSFTTPDTLAIGGCRYSSGSIGSGFAGKLLGFEIWQDNTLVFKIVPVVNAEGVYRFWDSVSEEFFDAMQGTTFVGGNF